MRSSTWQAKSMEAGLRRPSRKNGWCRGGQPDGPAARPCIGWCGSISAASIRMELLPMSMAAYRDITRDGTTGGNHSHGHDKGLSGQVCYAGVNGLQRRFPIVRMRRTIRWKNVRLLTTPWRAALWQLVRDPAGLLQRWHWKSAIFSSLTRSAVFFLTTLRFGSTGGAWSDDSGFLYRAFAAGILWSLDPGVPQSNVRRTGFFAHD